MATLRRLLLALLVLVALGASAPRPSDLGAQGGLANEAELADARALQATGAALAAPSIAEWLGPLAPVALSPYFGITCLSGMAMLAERGVIPGNALLERAGPLKQVPVFLVLLLLSLATSLPRLTKVSKPLVQALDFVETWSAVVIVLVLKHFATPGAEAQEVAFVSAGLLSGAGEACLAVIGALNVLVIAGVRFVFEVLVWLSPVPAVDALFEGGKKAVVAGLMAVYAFHPLAALILNLVILAGCLLAYGWAKRRLVYFQSVLIGPLLARVGWGPRRDGDSLVAFAKSEVGPFAAKSRLHLRRDTAGLFVEQRRLFRETRVHRLAGDALLDEGWFQHQLRVGPDAFVVSRSWDRVLNGRCEALGLTRVDAPPEKGTALEGLA